MAYNRKIQTGDIRSLTFKTQLMTPESPILIPLTIKATKLPRYQLKKELAHIILSCAPLLILLVIATYFEETSHWVIPLAERVMKLGA
ncbi:MAG TPA: hypothetical protein VGE59_02035 [Patescibacteria group bacterium]